jgi:hypothetical protein
MELDPFAKIERVLRRVGVGLIPLRQLRHHLDLEFSVTSFSQTEPEVICRAIRELFLCRSSEGASWRRRCAVHLVLHRRGSLRCSGTNRFLFLAPSGPSHAHDVARTTPTINVTVSFSSSFLPYWCGN